MIRERKLLREEIPVCNDYGRQFLGMSEIESVIYKNSINRFAMVSQSVMVPMEMGDQFYVLLHEGALKGGGISHTFTSLNGHKIATMALPHDGNDL